jgi:hypothetical protein
MFDLGPGGQHWKRFHAVTMRRRCLSLVYDSRYDGDQFIPPVTKGSETIGISIPAKNIDVRAHVVDFHQRLGCLDILNFLLSDEPKVEQPQSSQAADAQTAAFLDEAMQVPPQARTGLLGQVLPSQSYPQ